MMATVPGPNTSARNSAACATLREGVVSNPSAKAAKGPGSECGVLRSRKGEVGAGGALLAQRFNHAVAERFDEVA